MPNAEVWTLFPALAVVVLLLIVLGLGARAMWREYRVWTDGQDDKRAKERSTQRAWEEEQDAKRDARWQAFVQGMQLEQAKESAADRKTIGDLAEVIRGMQKAVEVLTTTLRDHIREDEARFQVLLTSDQKSAVEDIKTQPKKK